VECRVVKTSKKVWQPPSKQKQPVVSASASQCSTADSGRSGISSCRPSVSSTGQSSRAAVKPGSVSSREVPQNSSVALTSHRRNGEGTKKNPVSENGKIVNKNSLKTIAASAEKSLASSVPQDAADANSQSAASNVIPSGNRRLSDVNEPTKQPVAARLAAWKKKTAAVENASTSSQRLVSRGKLHVLSEGTEMHTANSRAGEGGTNVSSSAAVSAAKASDAAPDARDSSDERSKTSFPPLKDGEVRQRTLPRSKPVTKQEAMQPSWKKLGPATLEIQQKLTALCENWKRNEIAEKSRKERAEDMTVLENRWSNGLLADNQKETAVTSATCMPSTIPEIASHSQVHYCSLYCL